MADLANYNTYIQQISSIGTQATAGSSANYYVQHFGEILNGSMQVGTADGNSAATQSGIMRIVNAIVSIVTSNESSQADKEVKDEQKKLTKSEKEAQKLADKKNKEITSIGGEISAQNGIITNANDKLAENQKQMDEEQEAIQETIEQINALQAQLAASTSITEQQDILNQIGVLSSTLASHVSVINVLKTTVEDLSTQVENAYAEIETAKGNVVEVQEDGQIAIQEVQQDMINTVGDIATTGGKGATNLAEGKALEVAAEAASSNTFTAAKAPKLYRAANDQNMAGEKRTSGAVSNIKELQQGIGTLQNGANLMQTFNTQIGGLLNDFSGLIGSWNTSIEPMITSLGSYDNLGEQQENLDKAVTNDKKTLTDNGAAEKVENPDTDWKHGKSESKDEEKPTVEVAGIDASLFETPKVEIKLETK